MPRDSIGREHVDHETNVLPRHHYVIDILLVFGIAVVLLAFGMYVALG